MNHSITITLGDITYRDLKADLNNWCESLDFVIYASNDYEFLWEITEVSILTSNEELLMLLKLKYTNSKVDMWIEACQ